MEGKLHNEMSSQLAGFPKQKQALKEKFEQRRTTQKSGEMHFLKIEPGNGRTNIAIQPAAGRSNSTVRAQS